jgi:hypothetical protein
MEGPAGEKKKETAGGGSMIDLRCEHCQENEFGGFYCDIERKEFRNCEKCPFNTYMMQNLPPNPPKRRG